MFVPGPFAVFGWGVEVEPAVVEAFAEGVLVDPVGGGRCSPWGLGFGSGTAEWSAVATGVGDAAGGVGVAGDAEFTAMVHAMVSKAESDEVPRVGGAAVFPVHDVVYFEVVGSLQPGTVHPWSHSSTSKRVRCGIMRWVRPTEMGMEPSTNIGDAASEECVASFVECGFDDHSEDWVAFDVEAEHAVVADAPPDAIRRRGSVGVEKPGDSVAFGVCWWSRP